MHEIMLRLLVSVVITSLQLLNTVTPLATTPGTATLDDMVGAVSGDKMVEEIAAISRYSRCISDRGHDPAISYIQKRLQDYGLEVKVQSFTSSADRAETRLQNIIARKPGTNPTAKHLLTAHMDSSPTRVFPPVCMELSPGANDNASGVAALLEIGRLLSKGQFKDDIELVFFDGEEFGYLGSQYYVEQYQLNKATQLPIGIVINIDMIGYPRDGTTNQTIYAISQPGKSNTLAKEGQALVASGLPGVKYQVYTIGDLFPASRDPNRSSDQRSFWNAGIENVIFFNEDARDIISGDPRYHSPADTLYKPDGSLRLDPPMMAAATRAALLIIGTKAGPLPRRLLPAISSEFEKNWSRADRPVLVGSENGQSAGRSWTWGPLPLKTLTENYAEATGGSRKVVYFDKARMELTRADKDLVTNGLLVVELTTGRLQLGDASFNQRDPSKVAVAGDPNDQPGFNDVSPTYATFKPIVERGKTGQDTAAVTLSLDNKGKEGRNYSLAGFARNVFYVQETGHNIPDVFFKWFQSQGKIYDSLTDSYTNGAVMDWISAVGLPISEAYWTRAKVAGVEQDVLVQLYERRTLTFTPANPVEFRVEMGNVGQHYYKWRYGG